MLSQLRNFGTICPKTLDRLFRCLLLNPILKLTQAVQYRSTLMLACSVSVGPTTDDASSRTSKRKTGIAGSIAGRLEEKKCRCSYCPALQYPSTHTVEQVLWYFKLNNCFSLQPAIYPSASGICFIHQFSVSLPSWVVFFKSKSSVSLVRRCLNISRQEQVLQ